MIPTITQIKKVITLKNIEESIGEAVEKKS